MSKVELVEVNTPLNSSSFQHQINSNFEALSEALDKQLQRTEQENVDNFMERDIDMNSHRIINLAAPVNPNDAARKQDCDDAEIYAQRAEAAAEVAVEKADIATTAARDAAQDADDADAAKRAAISAAQSSVDAKDAAVIAQGKAEAAETAIRTLLTEDYPEITTVANNIADVNTVATNISDVNTVADNISDISTVVSNMSDINAVEDNLTSINTNAENIVAIQNASDNAQTAIDAANTAASYAAQMQTMGAMGDIRATMRNTLPPGAIWCDGAEGTLESYPELKQAIKDGTIPFQPLSNWSTYIANNNGQAPVFFVDATSSGGVVTFNSNTFRAPLMDDVFIEADKDASVPSVIAPGLPNITGECGNYGNGVVTSYPYSSGAMYVRAYDNVPGESEDTQGVSAIYGIDASRSSSLYGASNTVQPKAIKYRHYVVVKEYPRIIFVNKPSVQTYNNLPTTGNSIGDTRVVMNTHIIYCWVKTAGGSEAWNAIGAVGESGTPGIYALNDLMDVDITTPTEGQTLVYDSNTGFWVNANVESLPDQSGQSGKFLTTNGTTASWDDIPDPLPSQTSQGGKFLTTNGSNASWDSPFPAQAGNFGKVLKTNGVNVLWDTVDALPEQLGNANKILSTNGATPFWLLKEYMRTLTSTQAAQLLLDGTYNGFLVSDGEVFIKDNGTFQQFSDTLGTPTLSWSSLNTNKQLFASDGTVLAYTNGGKVYKSTDEGATFTEVASGLPSYTAGSTYTVISPFFYINNMWVILASGVIGAYVSTDLVNWNLITFDFGEETLKPSYINKTGFGYNGSVYAMIFKNSGNANAIYTSTDFEHWTKSSYSPNLSDSSYCKIVAKGSDFYYQSAASGSSGGIFKSTDNCTTFTKVGGSSFYYGGNIWVSNNVVYSMSSNGSILASSDDGATWTSKTSPVNGHGYTSLAYIDGTYVLTKGESSSIATYYTTDFATWTTSSTLSGSYYGPLTVCGNNFVCGNGYKGIYSVSHTYALTQIGAIIPDQTGQSGKFLTTNGTTTSWDNIPIELPSQSGNTGKFLTTDGTDASWAAVPEALPNQVGNAGKALYTDGEDASWEVTRDPNTYRSLSIEQETQLIVDGTYNGESATSGEIFTAEDGTFKEFTDTVTFEGITMLDYNPSAGGSFNGGCFKDWAWITMYKDSNGCFAITKDNGLTWSQTTPSNTFPGKNSYNGYGLTDDTTLYLMAGGYNGNFGQKTTDGINFTQFNCPANTPNQYYLNYGYCGGKFIVNKYYYGSDSYGTRGYVFSDDPSVSWTVGAYPTGVTNALMLIFSDSVYLIDEDTKRVYKTLPGDGFLTSWIDTGYNSDTTRGLTYTPNIEDLYVVNDIAFWMGNRNLEYSLDNGITWTQTSYSIKRVFYCKDTQTYIGLNHTTPTVYYMSTDGINWQQETVEAGKSIYTGCWTYNGNSVITLSNSASSRINTLASHHFAVDSLSYSKEELDELVLPPLADAGAPVDDTTEGTLGKIYIDTTNKDAYICVEADSSIPTYTWKKITP